MLHSADPKLSHIAEHIQVELLPRTAFRFSSMPLCAKMTDIGTFSLSLGLAHLEEIFLRKISRRVDNCCNSTNSRSKSIDAMLKAISYVRPFLSLNVRAAAANCASIISTAALFHR